MLNKINIITWILEGWMLEIYKRRERRCKANVYYCYWQVWLPDLVVTFTTTYICVDEFKT